MNEVTKRVHFLVDGNDINTGELYTAGTEIDLTRTENDFTILTEQGVIVVLDGD